METDRIIDHNAVGDGSGPHSLGKLIEWKRYKWWKGRKKGSDA